MPETARRQHRLGTGGPWGSALLLLGVLVTTYGVALILSTPDDLRGTLAWINHGIPVAGWGLLWVAAGVWSIGRAISPPQRHVDVGPAVGVLLLWAGLYYAYWIGMGFGYGTWTRDWLGGTIFAAFAAVIAEFSRCVNPPRVPKP